MIKKCYNILWGIFIVGVIFSLIYTLFSQHLHQADQWIANSDKSFAPAFAFYMIHDHNHFSEIGYSATPYFFPDLFISYIIGLFTQSLPINMVIYGILQIFNFILITALFLKIVTNNSITFSAGILFTMIVLLLSDAITHPLTLFSAILYSDFHFSTVLLGIGCLCLLILIFKQKKIYLVALFYGLTSIAIFSDILVGFYFTIPLILTILLCWFLQYISSKNCAYSIILIFLATLTGYYLYRYFPLYYPRRIKFILFTSGNIQNFITMMVHFFKSSPAMALLWFSFILFAPVSLIKTYLHEGKPWNPNYTWLNFIIFFELVMIVTTIPAYIITDSYLSKKGVMLLHVQAMIIIPIVTGLPLLIYKHTNIYEIFIKRSICGSGFFLILIATLNRPGLDTTKLSYYPPYLACLDEHAKKLNLHAGLGNYWQARPITFYNHSGIKIAPVIFPNVRPFYPLTSFRIFKDNQFDFIIVKSQSFTFDKEQIIKRFGQPTSIFTCPENSEYYVYKNDALKNIFTNLVFPKK